MSTDRPLRATPPGTHEAARELLAANAPPTARPEAAPAGPAPAGPAPAGPANPTASPARRPLTGAALKTLQRSAGNAAVSGMLTPQVAATTAAPAAATTVARQAAPTIPQNQPRATTAASAGPFAMGKELREAIEAETQMEISTAFTAFLHACDANITAMKAAAKARAEFAALIIDIATGFLAPAFANFVASRLVGRWAEKAATRLTTKSGEQAITLIAKNDILKAAFTGVAKTGADQIKRNSTALFGETEDEQILENLQNAFQRGAVALSGQIPSMTDVQLIAVWHAYDPMYADVTAYKTQVKSVLDQFASYVKSIHHDISPAGGQAGDFTLITDNVRAYWIQHSGRKRLALVDELEVSHTFAGERGSKKFRGWVPEMWAEMAQKRSAEVFGSVTEIQPGQLKGVPTGP